MNIPRVVVAGATSGVGKTTISISLMRALGDKGLAVQPFKVGPDFIDPSYHAAATGRASRNLDAWMMGESGVVDCFARNCDGADVAVIEGVMGLYDGMSGRDNFASTAQVAKLLRAPVILVLDASKTARSLAAIALGFVHFDRSIKIAGFIVNNVASDRHARYVADAINSTLRIPILGIVRRDHSARMQERHLGLVPAQELADQRKRRLLASARQIADQLDIEKIIPLFGSAPVRLSKEARPAAVGAATIAVALDESFNFYYQDNLDALKSAGAKLEFFSPVNDKSLPPGTDGIVLGGGFPEVLAEELERNSVMKRAISTAIDEGVPIYAECGGLMYLCRSIRGYKGSNRKRKMVGAVDADTIMTGRLTLDYTEASCNSPLLGRVRIRGHEFHYSRLENLAGDVRFAYRMSKGKGIAGGKDGILVNGDGIAAYSHLHFRGNDLARRLVSYCAAHSRR